MFDRLFITLQILRGDLADRLHRDEEGATMVEYGLIVAVIALVVLVGATTLGEGVRDLFDSVAGQLEAD